MGKIKDLREMKKFAKRFYSVDNSGHDYGHIKRVLKFCKIIWKEEKLEGEFDVLIIAALFHDVHRMLQSTTGKCFKPEDCLDEVKTILHKFDIEPLKLQKILYVIGNHENKSMKVDMPELVVLQDADVLDAIGKRGLKRTKIYCKTHNIPTKNLDVSLDEPSYAADINPISTRHYVYRTMIPYAQSLRTKTANRLAKNKIKVMEKFVAEQS